MSSCEKSPLLPIRKEARRKVGWLERRRRKRGLDKFNAEQRELLDQFEADDVLLNDFNRRATDAASQIEVAAKRRTDSLLATITFIINVTMLLANLAAAYLSHSYSVISAFVDSAMDITSGVVIWVAIRAINKTNPYYYPRGRSRLEPISVIICSVVMGVANIMMIIISVQSIIQNTVDPDANIPTVSILLGGILLKSLMMIACLRQGTISSRTLALDQRNDILTSIVALAGAVIGNHIWVYADPICAILVCTFVAGSWFYNAGDTIPLLSGKRADRDQISRIIRIAIEHDSRIKCLDTLMVYHIGNEHLVELHVVLDEDLCLREVHDIVQPLEHKLEALPFVEKAFIHCDYFCDGI